MPQSIPPPHQHVLLAPSRLDTLYEPLDLLQVRSPLFPVEAYLALAHEGEAEAYGLHLGDHRVQRALAVGSLALLDELERPSSSPQDRRRGERKLLRYLIRMATRPTPYGLFAGVGLTRFGAKTDLEMAESLYSMYTRPDMAWLFSLIRQLETIPEVRKHLHAELALEHAEYFQASLEAWRERWNVPRYVYLSQADNRLLLDLTCPAQIEELRASLRPLKNGEAVVLEEALPGPEHAWMSGPSGHYLTEFVVSLVRRRLQEQQTQTTTAIKGLWIPSQNHNALIAAMRLQPPGSEWLFVKLCCAATLQEDLLAGPRRTFVRQILEQQFAHDWFFIRYADPDPHIRLRFRGDPQVLISQLLPELCRWGSNLMREGACLKFVFDVYDREIERYGGQQSIHAAEAFFCADSVAVIEMLQLLRKNILQLDTTTLAVLSTNEILAGLMLSPERRLRSSVWCCIS